MRRTLPPLILLFSTFLALVLVPGAGSAFATSGDLDLVSRPSEYLPDGLSFGGAKDPKMSADGRFVVFTSGFALDSYQYGNSTRDVFIRDMTTGGTDLVSRASGEDGDPGDDDSFGAAVSRNGRYVAFVSWSTNLTVDPSSDDGPGVFVRDLQTNDTERIGTTTASGNYPDDYSYDVSISDDGRYVAYLDTPFFAKGIVYDRQTDTSKIVTRLSGANGQQMSSSGVLTSISGDGRYIAFSGGFPVDSYFTSIRLRDIQTDTTTQVNVADGTGDTIHVVDTAFLSGDGRKVFFIASGSDQVYRRDVDAGTTVLVSRADGLSGDPANDLGFGLSVSDDGNRVAFASSASNLVSPFPGKYQIYLRDIPAGTTTLVSKTTGVDGAPASEEGGTSDPELSGDGKYVAFDAAAQNLSDEDTCYRVSVFRRDIGDGTTPSIDGPTQPGPACQETSGGSTGNTNTIPPPFLFPHPSPTAGLSGTILQRRLRKRLKLAGQCQPMACRVTFKVALIVKGKVVRRATRVEKLDQIANGQWTAQLSFSKMAYALMKRTLAAHKSVRLKLTTGGTYRQGSAVLHYEKRDMTVSLKP